MTRVAEALLRCLVFTLFHLSLIPAVSPSLPPPQNLEVKGSSPSSTNPTTVLHRWFPSRGWETGIASYQGEVLLERIRTTFRTRHPRLADDD
ncbi:hypothetical protein OPV22_031095 [Ensete ventricosum]|uniref:Secreted protein n=1 Tax=Ensete ventricosum TaxID=4639 RepID=A0AAV8PIN2_ENSVE|nr:hypothetical protein OPV22_031095 [Ensete ventricosum]